MIMDTMIVMIIIKAMEIGNNSKSLHYRKITTNNSVSKNNSKSEKNITNGNTNHNEGFNDSNFLPDRSK